MTYSRRRALYLAGGAMSGLVSAGCLSNIDPGSGDDTDPGNGDPQSGDGTDGGDDTRSGDDDPGGEGDADEYTIDARLHNDGSESRTFELTIRNGAGEAVASDDWEVAAGDTVSVPAVGKPGEPRTFEVEVNGAMASESFQFDVDDTPGGRNGYVDVTYADGSVEIVFTPPEDDPGNSGELSRVDMPPYDITEPECSEDGDRDPLWLCENMPAEPSASFEQATTTGRIFSDEGLSGGPDPDAEGDQYYVTLLTDDGDRDRVADDAGGPAAELIEDADFEDEIVLVVQTGWGSGSETPHLKRIEETDDGLHAFGCSRRPCIGTTDVTARTAVARLDRPGMIDEVLVSLTEAPDHRVNLAADEGIVTVAE